MRAASPCLRGRTEITGGAPRPPRIAVPASLVPIAISGLSIGRRGYCVTLRGARACFQKPAFPEAGLWACQGTWSGVRWTARSDPFERIVFERRRWPNMNELGRQRVADLAIPGRAVTAITAPRR